jgi:hypothetical protein
MNKIGAAIFYHERNALVNVQCLDLTPMVFKSADGKRSAISFSKSSPQEFKTFGKPDVLDTILHKITHNLRAPGVFAAQNRIPRDGKYESHAWGIAGDRKGFFEPGHGSKI